MITTTDIDIDIADRNKLLRLIRNTPAAIHDEKGSRRHNTGVYFHDVPKDPFKNICSVDYKHAEDMGFFKIDVLNVNVYDGIESNEELQELLEQEPIWELLEHQEVVEKCFHIHKHYDILRTMRPQSIEQLAAVLAIIRPAKRYLLGKDWDTVMREVWVKPSDTDVYYFKKAHAIAYAIAIQVQLNHIVKDFSS
jgi:hypothetical protein